YEWGIHVAGFAPHIGLTEAQVRATVLGDASDPAWEDPAERVLIATVDALLDHKKLTELEWGALTAH
ncbi:hypothetical protein ACEV7R_23740, partial [Vibrio parahaemolyticus]